MRNIQVIDGANNCTYSIFQVSDEIFKIVFPKEGQDIEFNTDLSARLSEDDRELLNQELWKSLLDKVNAMGIHGTLFYDLDSKKKYYPEKRDSEMVSAL